MSTVIRMESVSKQFTLRHAKTLKRMATMAVAGKPLEDSFYAVRDVSFDVQAGQSIALMGHNGPDKSTLLKMVSGGMRPDAGRVSVAGEVAGLLEVGAGFHPDLTGRENVYLNAAIIGMSEAETNRRFNATAPFLTLEEPQVNYEQGGVIMSIPVDEIAPGIY